MSRESMDFDVVIVGAGPSGLAAALRIMQLAKQESRPLNVCVVEKGSEVGAHILSGAVFEPRALQELLPNWQELDAPLRTKAERDCFLFLTKTRSWRLPTPPQMHNRGNYIISLGNFCRWLARLAEAEGVNIFPGFAAAEVLYDEQGSVCGVATGDQGIGKDGKPTENYQAGVELRAKVTLFAEGCRGSLSKALLERFKLNATCDPQTYGLGVKELWRVSPDKHHPGKVVHSIGWPLDSKTYGGSFLYHLEDNLVSVGFVVGLDYQNPYLSPFQELQRFKTHPAIKEVFRGGERIAYGGRAISEGGVQSLPRLIFPGGAIIGDAAGFLNVPKIKGSHTAMKSGMLAAEAAYRSLQKPGPADLSAYSEAFKSSWLYQELHQARNLRPAFRWGLWFGLLYSALDTYVLRGKAPWTFKQHADHLRLQPARQCKPIDYPNPDGVLTFDRLSSVFVSNTNHVENQPVHLQIKNPDLPIKINLARYAAPEQYYCPAGVYEILRDPDGTNPRLHINAQNCIHCKTCDIKDPMQNINWLVPEGGGGPNYQNM